MFIYLFIYLFFNTEPLRLTALTHQAIPISGKTYIWGRHNFWLKPAWNLTKSRSINYEHAQKV